MFDDLFKDTISNLSAGSIQDADFVVQVLFIDIL